MPPDPAELYLRLKQLVETMPVLNGNAPLDGEAQLWLGRAYLAVKDAHANETDAIFFNSATNGLGSILRDQNAHQIAAILHRALAVAEQSAPAVVRGGFIPVNSPFDALATLGKVLSTARRDVLIVDPYMDSNTVTDFVPLVAEGVPTRLLADTEFVKPGLAPSVAAWVDQYKGARPLQARLSARKALHDRFIQIDQCDVWLLSQSLNAFAKRSPATINRAEPDVAAMKIAAYERTWEGAESIG